MDLFTHVIFAYLLSFIIWGPAAPQYIAAGALAGGLPDSDILLFPLARRFPALQHRGIVHSVLGVTIIAAVGSLLVPFLPYFGAASTLLYFVAMEIGGLSHLVLDGFTNFAVAPLAPFSQRIIRMDADVAVSLVTIVLTAGTLVVLILEHGTVAFNVWVETAWLLVAIYGGYLVLRGTARWRAGRLAAREGFTEVTPSTNPWSWLLIEEEDTPDRYRIRYRPATLGERQARPARSLEVAKAPARAGPVGSPAEALERSYATARARSRLLGFRHHSGFAVLNGETFEVTWYVLGMSMFGRSVGVAGTIDRNTGELKLRQRFLKLPAGV
ncbi:MAG: metal-dependent hydrolase [Thermoplasmata archaeon]|nr:metal-dependent hydrolase [Thermoplasmata archaeon]